LLYGEESYAILGACFEVYNHMGQGFLEAVYQECLEIELADRGLPFQAQRELNLFYKGRPLKQVYQPDFIVFDRILIEIKAASKLAPEHQAQLLNYLRATDHRLGLLVNFGSHPKLEYQRIIR
jgi:GxxExxY protein